MIIVVTFCQVTPFLIIDFIGIILKRITLLPSPELEQFCLCPGELFVSSAVSSLLVCPLLHSQTCYSKSQFSHFTFLLQNPPWFPINCKVKFPNSISMAFHSLDPACFHLDPACFHIHLLLLPNYPSRLQSYGGWVDLIPPALTF